MDKGFLVLFQCVGCCPGSDLYRFVKLSHESYKSKLTWMGLRWTVHLHLSQSHGELYRRIDSDKTLQVLRQWHKRSRWSTRSSASFESVVPAGRVEVLSLFGDPSRGLAKSS